MAIQVVDQLLAIINIDAMAILAYGILKETTLLLATVRQFAATSAAIYYHQPTDAALELGVGPYASVY